MGATRPLEGELGFGAAVWPLLWWKVCVQQSRIGMPRSARAARRRAPPQSNSRKTRAALRTNHGGDAAVGALGAPGLFQHPAMAERSGPAGRTARGAQRRKIFAAAPKEFQANSLSRGRPPRHVDPRGHWRRRPVHYHQEVSGPRGCAALVHGRNGREASSATPRTTASPTFNPVLMHVPEMSRSPWPRPRASWRSSTTCWPTQRWLVRGAAAVRSS